MADDPQLHAVEAYADATPCDYAISPMQPYADFVLVLLKPDAMTSKAYSELLRSAEGEVIMLARDAREDGKAATFSFAQAYAAQLEPHGIRVFEDIRGWEAWSGRMREQGAVFVDDDGKPLSGDDDEADEALEADLNARRTDRTPRTPPNSPEHTLWQIMRERPDLARLFGNDPAEREAALSAIAINFKMRAAAYLCGRRGERLPEAGFGTPEEKQRDVLATALFAKHDIDCRAFHFDPTFGADLPPDLPPPAAPTPRGGPRRV